ncbi:MlaD family protein [Nocardioides terrisoli]|uniref:MlaD family protein n=1 Tax=Nocardioides terrisoli TaxID=3388267 RepID=UPI00287B655C|nr:MlaD family protein [Nocardioides marmorisolisilvae]
MTRGVKVRLITFVLLAAVGIVYVAASYLGIVDRVLGRGLTVHATLPGSGGLYVGSEVDYRGVKVGKVSGMQVTRDGVRATLSLAQGTHIPVDSPFSVHNLTAVGEQYLDFEPPSSQGPYAGAGHTFVGTRASLPESTNDLLTKLSRFVSSVNGNDLRSVVKELGQVFQGNADALGRIVDSGSTFVQQARAHQDATIRLLDSGKDVLRTQQAHKGDIVSFARGLARLSQTLKVSDPQLRTILQGGGPAVREVNSLLTGLEPVLPVFISNLVTVNQVVTARLPALEQTLVTFPAVVSNGFTGTPGDGYGHLNMQYSYTTPPCTQGYMPAKDWPNGNDLRDLPLFPAKCTDPRAQPGYTGSDPIEQRGVNMAPGLDASTSSAYRVAPYDARTGVAYAGNGRRVRVSSQGGLDSVFGSNAWQQLLIGPVASGAGRSGAAR